MGYNFSKRLTVLKEQAEKDDLGRWNLWGTFGLCLLIFTALTFVLPKEKHSSSNWQKATAQEFETKRQWLQDSPLVLTPGASSIYLSIAQTLDSTFTTKISEDEEQDASIFNFNYFWVIFSRITVSCVLRFSLVLIAFLPLWLISAAVGYYALRKKFSESGKSETILGFCNRGNGPFYSGIYGPLRPNNSIGATDYASPGLACPAMEKQNIAANNPLTQMLKDYNAYNETNFSLIRVILKHGDYPSLVADETAWEEEQEAKGEIHEEKKSETGFITNANGNVKDSTTLGLSAILEARKKIGIYIDSLEKKGIKKEALDKNYSGHVNNLVKLTSSCTPLAKTLIFALTPTKLWALGKTPTEMICTAYLSTEAGKCLVYKRNQAGFIRTSNYPHLQARAILHSIVSYIREYNGDQRLTMRQAIISSRRHGDFGRAFLPIKMPIESRAIRDWLEILYSDPEKREDTANLVELDANIDEISINWKNNFANFTKRFYLHQIMSDYELNRGLPFKSVVLMPAKHVIEMSLESIHPKRLERITELLKITRKYQTKISISARLPGFKRQALEADDTTDESLLIFEKLYSKEKASTLVEHWKIVRRMLTKFNWMSTRVGDDAVPMVGIIKATVAKNIDFERKEIKEIEGLVPLRNRRLAELFGKNWEQHYYADAPTPEQIEVIIDQADDKKSEEDKQKSMMAVS